MKYATCVLIPQDGKFLAISRRNDTSLWGLPGGKCDPLETNVECAQRELREETGIIAAQTGFEPLWVGFCPGKLAPPVDYWVTTYLWVDSRVHDHELKPEEGFALRWMTQDELCDPAVSPFADYNVKVFEAFKIHEQA